MSGPEPSERDEDPDAYWHRVLKQDCKTYSHFMHEAIHVATRMTFILVRLQALRDEELEAIGISRAKVDASMEEWRAWHRDFKENFHLAS